MGHRGKKRHRHTELHRACETADVEAVSHCIRPDLIDTGDKDGQTPLMFACQRGSVDVARVLLEHRANVSCRDNEGRTALHWASFKVDMPEMIALLTNYGADPDVLSNLGLTALHYASMLGFPENARALLQAGADPALRYQGLTASELAKKYEQETVTQAIAGSTPLTS